MRKRISVAAAALTFALASCIDTDAAVFVEGSVTGPALTVQSGALVTSVGGSFTIALHLGPRASGPSDVSLTKVSVADAARTVELIASLGVRTTPDFPVTVPVDGDVLVNAIAAAEDNLLEEGAAEEICEAGPLVIVGVLDGGLRGGSITVVSEPFQPSGC